MIIEDNFLPDIYIEKIYDLFFNNNMIVFDRCIEHCSNTQTDADVRININMELI